MNQITGKDPSGKPFFALILEPGNLEYLRQHRPIFLHLEDMFPDGIPKRLDLIIDFSETPVADAQELKNAAEVALDERAAVSEAKRPICAHCTSTIEQLGVYKGEAPITLVFCVVCGCLFGALDPKVLQGVNTRIMSKFPRQGT